ncbi:MAG: antitoxin family protein, partial [Anaerolinea sp.]|nr:antitoxin family protein [Anaerolinea sp.]
MAAVRAVYLDGTLRLLDPVDLKAGQIVTLRIETAEQGDLDDPSIEWNSLTTSEQDALLRAEFGASVR